MTGIQEQSGGPKQLGQLSLGLELGSTRIKAVVIDQAGKVVDKSDYTWKSELVDGYWSYNLSDVDKGVQTVLDGLKTPLDAISAMGISAMMHGYLAFDADDNLLVPFRTWQNVTTTRAAEQLSKLFGFNVPERWSISHLYQAMLDNEEHVSKIAYITTLAGYVHYKFTGQKVLGIGDASGMFPVDTSTKQYNAEYVAKFDALLKERGLQYSLLDILPEIRIAGEGAGEYQSALAGNTGTVSAYKIAFCPPEGDAGTGMVATNAIKPKTGNVSAGTSVFAMIVLENALKSYYPEIDVVTTPLGDEVAMVHANNCTLDINAWVELFVEVLQEVGVKVDKNTLYEKLFVKALTGEKDGGGLVNFPYVTGEQIVGVKEGNPTFTRLNNANFTLANFMRVQLMSALAALKLGFDILRENEGVAVHQLLGHGGFFNTAKVGQEIMSAATNCEVGVMDTANEGGAWGMAVLAAFSQIRNEKSRNAENAPQTLHEYLDYAIFKSTPVSSFTASTADVDGFNEFMDRFSANKYRVVKALTEGNE